jgi:TM2 domain-containing membrane protein YozV
MESQKVDLFLMSKGRYFEDYQLPLIRDRLLQMPDDNWLIIQNLQFKDPSMLLIVSILVGVLGIDRFFIGDIALGVGKLITCGGFGIWTIVDWFLIMGATRNKNMEHLQRYLY